jgi:hypothetical protein
MPSPGVASAIPVTASTKSTAGNTSVGARTVPVECPAGAVPADRLGCVRRLSGGGRLGQVPGWSTGSRSWGSRRHGRSSTPSRSSRSAPGRRRPLPRGPPDRGFRGSSPQRAAPPAGRGELRRQTQGSGARYWCVTAARARCRDTTSPEPASRRADSNRGPLITSDVPPSPSSWSVARSSSGRADGRRTDRPEEDPPDGSPLKRERRRRCTRSRGAEQCRDRGAARRPSDPRRRGSARGP